MSDGFSRLPLGERFHVWARRRTAPIAALVDRIPVGSRVLDVGCGHGVLEAAVDQAGRARSMVGIDPDERKITWARRALAGRHHIDFHHGVVERLGVQDPFDVVVINDVLYLLPLHAWADTLDRCLRWLVPGGLLLVKEAEADGSWRHLKCVAQEVLMVRMLRRTAGSTHGTLVVRDRMIDLLSRTGFLVREVVSLSTGYTTPHILYVASRPG